ncbi:hypothetical protein DY000_02039495 [Brassica cretica]|uniref:Uncharacterized protein n=1 Tax=Brassica cretica TaxID=69181 RepID=A0ABQ7BJW1_BRACR|nr:hypothetical protein DY000_02039495 [Brassica cretica]
MPKPQVIPLQSSVPIGPGPKPQAHNSATYEKDERSSSKAQHLLARFTTLTNSKSWRTQKRSSWKYCRRTRQPLKGGYNALEYLSNSTWVVPRKEPCPSAGNTAAPSPTKEPEKMLTLQQRVLVLIPSTHLEQRGVKEAGERIIPLPFIQKEKLNLWVLGFSFQVPDPSFQEDTNTRKVGADELSVNPRATRINNSNQHARGKEDSRRGDESSNDVQKTLRVAHPRGSREQTGR